MASSRFSISKVLMFLSLELSPTYRRLVSKVYCSEGILWFIWSSSMVLKVSYTETSSISVTSDLLEMQILCPLNLRFTELETAELGPRRLFLQALQVVLKYTKVWEPSWEATPAQSQREGSDESLPMGGTQVPTYSLTAGTNILRSLVGSRPEEWVGRDGWER